MAATMPPKKRELDFVKGDESWDDAFFDPLPEEELQLWGGRCCGDGAGGTGVGQKRVKTCNL
jgi:hypothetical protein